MSVKHIKQYFNEVADQYHDLLEEIRDFENEAKRGLIEPERLDLIKESIKPLVNNFQTLSYIMFLLNMPNRKEKQPRYVAQNKKLLKSIDEKFTKQGIIDQNNSVLNNTEKIIKGEQ